MSDKTWTTDEIRDLLKTNDNAVFRGILKIYEFQTEDEKQSANTRHDNGIGFNGVDAVILSSFAVQIDKWSKEGYHKFRAPLSPKQTTLARKKIVKYAKQLRKVANREFETEAFISQL